MLGFHLFRELSSPHQIPELEKEILTFWEKNSIFEKSVNSRDPDKHFVFYEGPPTANGKPGIHHVISRTVKDLACRLRAMQGYRVERKAGWDTHGLPVEIEVEKELGIDGKEQVLEYGIDKFNQRCKENVFRYKTEWDELTRRIAFWVDLDNPYITYTNDYIETVWWILKSFWEKGLLYEGHKIVPYCPRCETALSSHEVSLGYREVPDPSIYVRMKLVGEDKSYFLVWTTTPWTLISNVALAVHPDETYVRIRLNDEELILVKNRLDLIEGDYAIVSEFKGHDLVGIDYEPPFTFLTSDKHAWYVIEADFVTTEEGTGIVHTAPAFGEDDYDAGKKNDLPFFQPVDKRGCFNDEVTDFKGQFVKDSDRGIIEDLKARGLLFRKETYIHSYPHCWRCDSPLLYYAKESWYIRTTSLKDKLIANNQLINWVPKEVGEGRFGEWLNNNVDWSLSRDRFWGTPLNIWKCDECHEQDMIGSVEELLRRSGLGEIADLHKPFIDEVKISCNSCSGSMTRTPEVIDVWFDSGSMPYAQWHYPFENKEVFERNFPADFISEGIDQTRGWFYSLLAISTLLFEKPAYKTCLSIEMILDREGQKMSKSKGNTVNPFEVIDRFGADPLRWYLITVNPPWLPTRFDTEGIVEVQRRFYGTLINTYSFFAMYANIDGFDHSEKPVSLTKRPEIDRWVLSALDQLVKQANEYLERFDVTKAARAISEFVIEDLSNWYVRRSRRRFWKSEMGQEKLSAYQTLYEVLLSVTKLMAPFSPFVAEALYRNLNSVPFEPHESVHLARYPERGVAGERRIDQELLARMDVTRVVVSTARALRSESGIKVRQPISRLIVATKSSEHQASLSSMKNLILEEINAKSLELLKDADQLSILKARPNFKALGPKFGKRVNEITEFINKMKPTDIAALSEKGQFEFGNDGNVVEISNEDVEIFSESPENLASQSAGDLTVALDLELTDSLKHEGLARELVNRVQNMRKDAGLEVTDRIDLHVTGPEEFLSGISEWTAYIKNETLAEKLNFESARLKHTRDFKIDGHNITISIALVKSAV